ncbi:hypothetical protein F441_17569 [Phytophthora nicotianae CJ01A1]|uniref:FYVE-type domain-containing protein n=5 Tax=Phytophthora nicotianae TaxID=4792 RepID=V9ECB4_PHYNI|nr:hypothetical protein F443_17693 [Phytophthora nicotianae P1569]ETK76358.1 hypothetical protein L915_17232 [Phytophthora nicotianae]ETO64856.1 hypothetical protein F444_17734 [Phytophthora nicotianae P1976]ETP05963.1 hypothetical protein F441_17569 [Phytophthora nicotianae CJ01A1]ETP34048.1 hypothetical protein F442_17550 [Phytophthora nicotianae P10297]
MGSTKAPYTSPYAPLVLTTNERKRLRQLAKSLIEVNVDSYEEFLYVNEGHLPEREWKFFRRDEQVETYVRRRDKYNLNGFGAPQKLHASSVTRTTTSLSSTRGEEFSSLNVADIRSIGQRSGTIEEAVHGAMCPTTEMMRYNSEYLEDGMEDGCVLAIIDNVTQEDPFTSLSIRWGVTENSPIVRKVIKSYDHVYLDATGFTQLSNGERVGYHLVHSVDFKGTTPPLQQYFRGQVAAIGFWRQVEPDVVQIHGHGVYALPFERARNLFVPAIATSLSKSMIHVFYASQMKKLRCAIREQRMQMLFRPQWSANHPCSVCKKKRTLNKGSSCELCGEHVCKVCRITHKMPTVELDNKMHHSKMSLCPFCMLTVTNKTAAATVRAEVGAGQYGTLQ